MKTLLAIVGLVIGFAGVGIKFAPTPSDIEAILANLTKAIGNIGSVDFAGLANDLQSVLKSARDGIDAMHLDRLGDGNWAKTERPSQIDAFPRQRVAYGE